MTNMACVNTGMHARTNHQADTHKGKINKATCLNSFFSPIMPISMFFSEICPSNLHVEKDSYIRQLTWKNQSL